MQLVGLLPLTLILSGGYEYPCSHYAYNIDGAFGVMSFLKAMSCIRTMRKVVCIAFLPLLFFQKKKKKEKKRVLGVGCVVARVDVPIRSGGVPLRLVVMSQFNQTEL